MTNKINGFLCRKSNVLPLMIHIIRPMKKLIILFVYCFSLHIISYSQPYDPEKVNKKAVQLYNQAMERAQDGNLTMAAGLLLKCIETDSKYLDAYLSLAGVYGQLKIYKSSIAWYEKAFAQDTAYTIEYKLPYSIQLAGSGEFEKALNAINELLYKKPPKNENALKTYQYRKRCYEFAVDYAKKNAGSNYVFAPKNLGSSINTSESEYFPSLSIDGKELVFTRRVNDNNEDFYYSKLKSGGEWDKAKPMEGEVNTPANEAAQNISQDGQWLVFTADGRQQGFGGFDIYISYSTPQGWSEAFNVGGKINSDQWDSQPCLSPDKRDLYFASRRFGGYGGSDIYVSHMQTNGKWGEPENLGPDINSSADEQCPFIHADNQTLYFTSPFWQGYGDDDIFYVRKGPDGKWGKPVNLGYPINTISREGTLFIAADGKTAYYASDRSDSKGGTDIYSFELREDVRPHKTLWVKGQVFDKKTTKGLPSSIELIELSTKQLISKVQTDENGNYLVTLPVGKDYAFNVNRKGYLFYSDNFLLTNNSPDSSYEKNIGLQPLEVNATIVLNNVFFDVNKFELKTESQVEMDKLVQLLKDNPTLKIQISGHTDNVGKPTDNLALSNNRAKAVVNYLVANGIAALRLSAKGFGETQPIADNKTEDGRANNRRTEMKVVGQ
jgi:outer membrane protein OmpA-like peptidoglycan-associated protein/tetratricopeptide (TPR) repeat protein